MTLNEAINWVEKNCTEEVCKRIRSRAVARTLLDEIERLQTNLIIAAYDTLLQDVCNEYMDVNDDGRFKSHNELAERVNKLLGI
ncbi:hypothetical protein GW796_09170 [archaeon]|nr:hypothetical protein [archaeon]